MRHPMSAVASLYAGGVLLGFYFPGPLPWLFALAFALALAALLCAGGRRLLLCLLLPLAGWTFMSVRSAVLSPHDLCLAFGTRTEYVTVRARIVQTPVLRVSTRRTRLVERSLAELAVTSIRLDGQWQQARGRVIASTPGTLDLLFFSGQHVEVTGVLQPPKPPAAPGQFDYRRYLQFQGIFHLLRTQGTNDWQLGAGPDTPPETDVPWGERFCRWAQRQLGRGLPEEDESLRLLWAMVLGWKTALTPEVSEPFIQSGTLHVFAISGMHIALIAGILVSLFRVLRVPRSASGVLVVPLIWFYTAATGWQASAIRSTVMMTIVIAGWALRRPSHLVNSLAGSALLILLWDPAQLVQAGFQLSFFVVLGIALLVPPLERVRERLLQPDPLLPPELRPRWKKLLDWPVRAVTQSLATSLAAWLGSLPLIAYYFNTVTPCSLLANLLIVPLSSFALMSSLGSLVCGPWCSWLAELFNHSSWLWMFWMVWLSEWFAGWPGAYFYVPQPTLPAAVTYYLLLVGVLTGAFTTFRWRRWVWLGTTVVMLSWWISWQRAPEEMRLTVLPGRACTTFVDAPGRKNDLLIDSGDAAAVESMTKPFLRSQGVNRLPRLLLSHVDAAHAGGALPLAAHFLCPNLVIGPARFRSPAYRELLRALESPTHPATSPVPAGGRRSSPVLERIGRGDARGQWKVLHPDAGDQWPQGSDNALVMRGQVWETTVLFLSDLGRLGQRQLLAREPGLRSDILITGIIASDGLSDVFLQAVQPRLVIVGCAEYPATARPSARLKERLARLGVPVIYTGESGAATIHLTQTGWRLVSSEVLIGRSVGLSLGRSRGARRAGKQVPARDGEREQIVLKPSDHTRDPPAWSW